MPSSLAQKISSAMQDFSTEYNTPWTLGTNWTNVGNEQFELFINKFLFPKLVSTDLINIDLGNRFNFLAKEEPFIGQFTEEYVIKDAVPVSMDLTQEATLMLKRNYPQMITKLYGAGKVRKMKFTLNDNENRLSWLTLADAISYAMAVLRKRISDINVLEEREIRAMLVSYAQNFVKDKRIVTSLDDLDTKVFNAILNIQNNSAKYNESSTASNGEIGRFTTKTKLDKIAILTTDAVKTFLLNSKIANTFQTAGIDLTKRIISFDDLGGNYQITENVTISEESTLKYFQSFGDYQMKIGTIIPKGAVLTFDIETLPEFAGKIEEIKPVDEELFAYIFDVDKVRYKRSTSNMIKSFENGEFDETHYWLKWMSNKAMSPFYNSVLITGE